MYIDEMVSFLKASDFSNLSKEKIERLKFLLKGGCLRIERFLSINGLEYLLAKDRKSEFIKLFLLMKKTLKKTREESAEKKLSTVLIEEHSP